MVNHKNKLINNLINLNLKSASFYNNFSNSAYPIVLIECWLWFLKLKIASNRTFDHFWPNMTEYDHFWPLLTKFDHFWPNMTKYDQIWPNMTNFVTDCDRLWPIVTIYDHFGHMTGHDWSWLVMIGHDRSNIILLKFRSSISLYNSFFYKHGFI